MFRLAILEGPFYHFDWNLNTNKYKTNFFELFAIRLFNAKSKNLHSDKSPIVSLSYFAQH